MPSTNTEHPINEIVQNRVISNRGNVRVVESTPEDREKYLSHLKTLFSFIKEEAKGFEGWWVIGGIARDAFLHPNSFVTMSPDGQYRDVDLLFSQQNKDLAQKIRKENPTPISVGAVFHNFAEITPVSATLRYGKIQINVPVQTFATQIVNLGEVEFPTVPVETLFHLYCLGENHEGKMREKDFLNAFDLARYIKANPDPRYPESFYRGFHKFSKLRNAAKTDLNSFLYGLAREYKNSPLNKILAVNDPRLMPLFEHVWQICGDFSLSRAEKKPSFVHQSTAVEKPQTIG